MAFLERHSFKAFPPNISNSSLVYKSLDSRWALHQSLLDLSTQLGLQTLSLEDLYGHWFWCGFCLETFLAAWQLLFIPIVPIRWYQIESSWCYRLDSTVQRSPSFLFFQSLNFGHLRTRSYSNKSFYRLTIGPSYDPSCSFTAIHPVTTGSIHTEKRPSRAALAELPKLFGNLVQSSLTIILKIKKRRSTVSTQILNNFATKWANWTG